VKERIEMLSLLGLEQLSISGSLLHGDLEPWW